MIGEQFSPAAVRDIVKKRSSLAGLGQEFSAHSLRSGFVTEAGRQQVPLGETMAMTGHRSTAPVMEIFSASSTLAMGHGYSIRTSDSGVGLDYFADCSHQRLLSVGGSGNAAFARSKGVSGARSWEA